VYDEAEMSFDILSPEVMQAVIEGGIQARKESLALGLPVFYRDAETDCDMMELPDGRRFQIRLVPGVPRGHEYEIIREVIADAA
jgi:hypothetical protein